MMQAEMMSILIRTKIMIKALIPFDNINPLRMASLL